jgi:hypothetical protein
MSAIERKVVAGCYVAFYNPPWPTPSDAPSISNIPCDNCNDQLCYKFYLTFLDNKTKIVTMSTKEYEVEDTITYISDLFKNG